MRRYIPALLLLLTAAAPFPLTGCTDLINKLKGGGDEDAAADAAVVAEPEVDAETPPPADPLDTDAGDPTVAPTATLTTTPTATPTTVRVDDGGVTDAGTKADAAAPVADAGAKADAGPAPAPTPTLTVPVKLFDGGLLPQLRVDAGGWKPPWQK